MRVVAPPVGAMGRVGFIEPSSFNKPEVTVVRGALGDEGPGAEGIAWKGLATVVGIRSDLFRHYNNKNHNIHHYF